MSIGLGVLLFAIGAVLTFALQVEVEWVDLDMVGYIFMGAGVIVFIVGLILMVRRRRADSVSTTHVDPVAGERVTRRSTEYPDDVV